MSLSIPIPPRPLAAPIVEVPPWSSCEKSHVVRKCPSSPDIGVQNSFIIATSVRRSPITHEVSDASGQLLCMVKRGGHLRRRRLRCAITTDGRELNWSLYMPKESKGFPRFLWCGGRKSEGKETAMTTTFNTTSGVATTTTATATAITASLSSMTTSRSSVKNTPGPCSGDDELLRLNTSPNSRTSTSTNSSGYKHKNEVDKLSYYPSSPSYAIIKSISHYDNGNVRDEAILASAIVHSRSMSSPTGGLSTSRGVGTLIALPPVADFTQLNSNNYCPLGISSELGVKSITRNKRQKSSSNTATTNTTSTGGPYHDNREIIIETCIKEYIKNMNKKPLGNHDMNVTTNPDNRRISTSITTSISGKNNSSNNKQDDAHHRLLYFHWKTFEYAWRWNPTTRRLDCLCTRPNQYINRSTSNSPVTTPLRRPQAAISTPSLPLSFRVSPNSFKSSRSFSIQSNVTLPSPGYFSRPTATMTSRNSYSNNGGNNGRRTSLTPTNTTTIMASVVVPLPSKRMITTTSLEFPEERCNDADLEQMLLLSCTLLIEQLIRIDISTLKKHGDSSNLTMNDKASNEMVVSTTNGRYLMQDTASMVRDGGRSGFAQSKRLTWFSYRSSQRRKSSCDSVDI